MLYVLKGGGCYMHCKRVGWFIYCLGGGGGMHCKVVEGGGDMH